MISRNSYTSLLWAGEQGPSIIVDKNRDAFRFDLSDPENPSSSSTSDKNSSQRQQNKFQVSEVRYGSCTSFPPDHFDTIRFQVVIWSIDRPDMTLSRVSMKFRVTLFWNVPNKTNNDDLDFDTSSSVSEIGHWVMEGRNKAKLIPLDERKRLAHIEVPPLSIINAESFTAIGAPEITLLRESDGLMRWTCLYKATLLQNDMMVDNFPHDEHSLSIQLGILQNRHNGGIWNRNRWKLALATADDSRGSIRVPHGLVMNKVKIPEFSLDSQGPSFNFVPLSFGATNVENNSDEECLEVKIRVFQDSGYYDQNIMPLFLVIAVVAMLIVTCLHADEFFQRGLMLLNCAFVEVSLRMNIDSRLPRVRYQIKLQRILNDFFFILFFLVVESGAVHICVTHGIWSMRSADWVDIFATILAFLVTTHLYLYYYYGTKGGQGYMLERIKKS